jgi:S1-C subfamily serine protease
LQIDAKQLAAIPLGDSEKRQVGDFVVAIGGRIVELLIRRVANRFLRQESQNL